MLTLRGEKSALWNAWKRKDQTFYQCAVECRAIGIHWSNIKAIVTARRKAGEDITIQRWATQHAPVSVRWLNEYSDFASRWSEFIETWRWSQSMPYSPERRAGLHTFQDLMLAKQRFDCVSRTRQVSFGGRGERIASAIGNSVPMSGSETSGAVETLTPTTRLICGDVAGVLAQHVADGEADVAIADPPYWLSRYHTPASGADRCYTLAGMTPRFDQGWDKFDSVEHYELEAERWLSQIMRCLNPEGSAFIFGNFHNIGLINRLCQIKGYYIINEIIWVVRNSRPNARKASCNRRITSCFGLPRSRVAIGSTTGVASWPTMRATTLRRAAGNSGMSGTFPLHHTKTDGISTRPQSRSHYISGCSM